MVSPFSKFQLLPSPLRLITNSGLLVRRIYDHILSRIDGKPNYPQTYIVSGKYMNTFTQNSHIDLGIKNVNTKNEVLKEEK